MLLSPLWFVFLLIILNLDDFVLTWFDINLQAFVYYFSVDLYLGLQLLCGSFYVFGTVVGILRLQAPAIRLQGQDENSVENGEIKLNDEFEQVIPPPTRQEAIKLGLIALVVSFAASIPLNFAPKP